MPKLFVITDEWNEQSWFSTGGTRAKKYFQAPNGRYYYFKQSQLRPGRDYRFEFWGEIIASELGGLLGFNVLQYDIATMGGVMGCICESMINSEEEELVEGVKFIQAFAPTYDPTNKTHQDRYTFQMIENSLKKAKLKDNILNIIELIVFDSLIGNGDRHQENWAVIRKHRLMHKVIEEIEDSYHFKRLNRFLRWIIKWMKERAKKIHEKYSKEGQNTPKVFYLIDERFAPIYDNGSSLARELLDEKVNQLLNSDKELNWYIDKGTSEIHWNGNKINHFDLIRHLLDSEYKEAVTGIIKRIVELWNGPKIEAIIQEVDRLVPENQLEFKIPENRKQLIIKIITLRRQRLENILNEGI